MNKRNRAIVDKYKEDNKNCEISGIYCHEFDPHHIWSVGAGGPDKEWNLIRLTLRLHKEIHLIGNKKFCIRYKNKKIREVLKMQQNWTPEDEIKFGS